MSDGSDLRKRNAERTREAILAAAQDVFSTTPYGEASLKEITHRAGANPALVSRYFGSKEKLFEEALSGALDVGMLTSVPRDRFGEAIAELFTTPSQTRINPLPMLIFSAANKETQAIAVALLHKKIMQPLERWIGGADAAARAAEIMAVSTGFFTFQLILPLQPFQGRADEGVRQWLARSLQAIIDG
ncbi:MAG: TetR family transcriptional regulator [Alphaproteobacteria bacterium HGW-Alphaproteobacteria-18]|nr:MAG: TetR family transcriptional regulator [Alphaproteobacteria bacterium HGW-Alphaproteobacteria-18]